MRLFVILRGIELAIEGTLCDAEPDVGIMSAYLDEFEVKDPPEAVDWDFTDDEIEAINLAAREAVDYYEE